MSLFVADPRKGLFAENISFTKLNIETVASPLTLRLVVRCCLSVSAPRVDTYVCMHRYTYKKRVKHEYYMGDALVST